MTRCELWRKYKSWQFLYKNKRCKEAAAQKDQRTNKRQQPEMVKLSKKQKGQGRILLFMPEVFISPTTSFLWIRKKQAT